MTFTFNTLLLWLLHVINSAIPVIVGIVVAGRINKLIERKDEDENPEEKEKIITPFAIKCPVCNGRGEVRAHLYKDDSSDINMTYVTCHACKGHGYIIRDGAELVIY